MSKKASYRPQETSGTVFPAAPPLPPGVPGSPHGHDQGHDGRGKNGGLPIWLWLAFAVVLLVGVIGIGGKQYFADSAAFEAMKTCDVTLADTVSRMVDGKRSNETLNGLSDAFPFLHITAQRDALCDVFSQCDVQPQQGLKLFRKGLDADGNRNSRIIALSCAVYLARAQTRPEPDPVHGVLEKEDLARIIQHLDPALEKEADVRKVALRAFSDLTILSDEKGAERYEKLPAGTTGVAKTHADKFNGKNVLLIRWSTPEAALAWFNDLKGGGKWDVALQRFIIP